MKGYEEIQRRMVEIAQKNPSRWRTVAAAKVAGVQVLDEYGNPHFTSKAKCTTTIKGRLISDKELVDSIIAKLREEGVPESELKGTWYYLTHTVEKKLNELYKELVKQGIIVVYEVTSQEDHDEASA